MKNEKYQKMYADYLQGLSLDQVGKIYGMTRQSVYSGFKVRNFKLRGVNFKPFQIFDRKKFSLRPTGYYELTNSDRTPMHIYVWRFYNGEIMKGYEIHHIDFDKSNNNIENLQLLTKSEHTKLHSRILKGAANNKKIIRVSDSKIWNSIAELCRELGNKSVASYILKGKPYKGELYEYFKG